MQGGMFSFPGLRHVICMDTISMLYWFWLMDPSLFCKNRASLSVDLPKWLVKHEIWELHFQFWLVVNLHSAIFLSCPPKPLVMLGLILIHYVSAYSVCICYACNLDRRMASRWSSGAHGEMPEMAVWCGLYGEMTMEAWSCCAGSEDNELHGGVNQASESLVS
jgi:hypothetical protein